MEKKVTIIGSGMMGAGIGACSVLSGYETVLYDIDKDKTDTGLVNCKKNIDQLVYGELATRDAATEAKKLLRSKTVLKDALEGSFLVIEAATEDLKLKQAIFRELDELTKPEVILTSNTSGLRISDIVINTKHPERTATTHFWYPAHLVLLVEIVLGDNTSVETGDYLRELLLGWGKSPVVVKRDLPGQLANRILQAVIREAINIVDSGLATAEDVDTAIKAGMALRFPVWGPLEHIDGVGLDLALSVQKDVLPDLNNDDKPNKYLTQLCAENNFGFKSGKGFYDWNRKSMSQLADCRDTFIVETVKLLRNLKSRGTCQ